MSSEEVEKEELEEEDRESAVSWALEEDEDEAVTADGDGEDVVEEEEAGECVMVAG